MSSSISSTASANSNPPRSCLMCRAFLCKWQDHDVCVLHYPSGCVRGGSCPICKDWPEDTWVMSDATRDRRLAKLAARVTKKPKGSVK